MSSSLKVDTLKNSQGDDLLVNGYPRQPGQIIEYLASPCDGSLVKVLSGEYTFQQVTGIQVLSVAYSDVLGSVMAYVPPAGTRQVIYKYVSTMRWEHDHAISHWKFFIDSDEVVQARVSRSGRYPEDRMEFEWVINIGGTANPNTGRQASWTVPKILKLQSRWYSDVNARNLHATVYWDGASSAQLSIPLLTILAIA